MSSIEPPFVPLLPIYPVIQPFYSIINAFYMYDLSHICTIWDFTNY